MRACALRGIALALFLSVTTTARGDYALRDGDTVVFLGDSITAARTYGKIIENYTLLRFPQRKVRFINAGIGGDTATGGLARLERDVFERGATVLLVCFGLNDIGWGLKANDEHKQKYLDAIRDIVVACKKRKVRAFICSGPVTAEDPAVSEASYLQKMCDEGMALARAQGEGAIDVQRAMREIQKRVWAFNATLKDGKGKTSLHAADGVHLSDLGQLAMAYAILKGLGAPANVSAVTLDAAKQELVEANGCQVSGLKCGAASLEFTRLDEGRPINFGLFGALSFRFVPIPEQLNRYMLKVHNLPVGRYEIRAEDRPLGKYTSQQLAAGLNLSFVTPDPWQPGGPWDVEATVLSRMTDARNELGLSKFFTGFYALRSPQNVELHKQMDKINADLEELQRTLVKPVPYRFVIRLIAETK